MLSIREIFLFGKVSRCDVSLYRYKIDVSKSAVYVTEALQDSFMLSKCPQGEPKFKTFGEEKNLPLGITDSDYGNEPAAFCVFLDFC